MPLCRDSAGSVQFSVSVEEPCKFCLQMQFC